MNFLEPVPGFEQGVIRAFVSGCECVHLRAVHEALLATGSSVSTCYSRLHLQGKPGDEARAELNSALADVSAVARVLAWCVNADYRVRSLPEVRPLTLDDVRKLVAPETWQDAPGDAGALAKSAGASGLDPAEGRISPAAMAVFDGQTGHAPVVLQYLRAAGHVFEPVLNLGFVDQHAYSSAAYVTMLLEDVATFDAIATPYSRRRALLCR